MPAGHLISSWPHVASPEGRDDDSLQYFCCRHRATKGINSKADANVTINIHPSSECNSWSSRTIMSNNRQINSCSRGDPVRGS